MCSLEILVYMYKMLMVDPLITLQVLVPWSNIASLSCNYNGPPEEGPVVIARYLYVIVHEQIGHNAQNAKIWYFYSIITLELQ